MSLFLNNIDNILQAALSAISGATTMHDLDNIKSLYLGKKGELTAMLRHLVDLEASERPKFGQAVNTAKEKILEKISVQHHALKLAEVTATLKSEAIDITLPSRGQELGSLHPLTMVRRRLEDIFGGMGFIVADGPEIETDYYNFTALNVPPYHPARSASDTFYFDNGTLLRTQTSPVQIRSMQKMNPPLRIICPGRVFRRDSDATHSPMFHQLEMLMVDKDLNLANLKWIIGKFLEKFFHKKVEYRFRPSFFPFTEPSAEVDFKWQVGGNWRWLELGGCGVVHPNVLRAGNIDPNEFQGLAFGFGIDRLAMIYYGITDIRMLFESDLQFLRQF